MLDFVDDSNQEWYDRVAKGKKALQVRRAKLAKVFRQAISDDDPVTVANAAGEYFCLLSSEKRASALLRLLGKAPAWAFWTPFLMNWSCCDDSWKYQKRVAELLQQKSTEISPILFYNKDAREFYDGLSDRVEVYRGCHRSRVTGLSWTIDQAVANGFADGHRGIHYPDPVVAVAEINKADILSVFVDRQECEVLAQPKKYKIYPYIRPRYRDVA